MSDKKKRVNDLFNGEETHPAYVTVRFSRITGGGRNFFGSSIDCHSWIELQVNEATRFHSLGEDRVHSGKRLLELRLTPHQFAELLTGMNVGGGVPGTLEYIEGRGHVPDIPKEKAEVNRVQEHFRAIMKENVEDFKKARAEIDQILENKKSLSQVDRKQISGIMNSMVNQFIDSMPFYLKQFDESAQKVVVEAKSEVDAFVTHVVQATGLAAIKAQMPQLSGPEGEKNQ